MASEALLEAELFVSGASRPRLELSLSLMAGVTVLSGPSGAGKSSCLFALAGLLRPQRGRIVLAGRTLFDSARSIDVPARRRGIALLFQSLALFPHLSVEQNVAFGAPRALSRAARREVAQRWLQRMRVAELAHRRPATLSGGEAQRVALARALASAPSLLLLDEPYSALHTALRRDLAGEVTQVATELQIPVLLVTHDEQEARAAREVIVLREGRRAADPSQPLHAPAVPR